MSECGTRGGPNTRCLRVECEGSTKQKGTHPITTQHLSRSVHTNRSDETRFYPQEPMIQQGHLRQELAQRSRLDIIIVCFADLPHPAIRRAVVRYLKFERL